MSNLQAIRLACIPTCPKCGKHWVLALSRGFRIRCLRDAGGCGEEFPIERINQLYAEEAPHGTNPSSVKQY